MRTGGWIDAGRDTCPQRRGIRICPGKPEQRLESRRHRAERGSRRLQHARHRSGKTPVTLWAWEAASSNWYFYAPTLAAQGGTKLSEYVTGKGYLDFVATGRKLGSGGGFWVNSSN